MRIIFAGSPEYAIPSLEALNSKFGVAAVITQPDRPVGRKSVLTPTAVKAKAQELNIPVYDFEKIREHVADVKALGGDILITCAYGQMLSQQILDCFPQGVWNLHASLLPKFRGASPVQSAILAGEEYTGVTVMRTELKMDTGDILLVKRYKIHESDTCGDVQKELSVLSAEAAVEAVELIASGNVQLLVQDEAQATYCKKIQKSDAKIDFTNSSRDICRLINAMNPNPMAFCYHNGNVLNILRARRAYCTEGKPGEVVGTSKTGVFVKCGEENDYEGDGVHIIQLQPAGGKKMHAADYANGRKIKAGDKLD